MQEDKCIVYPKRRSYECLSDSNKNIFLALSHPFHIFATFEIIMYIKNLMGLAGLSVREDTIGNIFWRCVVATGSHIDAIPYSGKFDGVVGV
ncbi:hypothetical protein K2173_012321 [Erythroxylum novogranatense]|uniref:Uncharacterized protein n=1 Tax=Erythroxylum novogranatense TaxID=1862640 RepID=A0AAV8SC61_9ROSI|nr:hypothetical protein K2173_012321 [Erythroxylum novogranatense]